MEDDRKRRRKSRDKQMEKIRKTTCQILITNTRLVVLVRIFVRIVFRLTPKKCELMFKSFASGGNCGCGGML